MSVDTTEKIITWLCGKFDMSNLVLALVLDARRKIVNVIAKLAVYS